MEHRVLLDKSIEPNDDLLLEVLGGSGQYWKKIKQHLNDEYGDFNEIWKYYYQKSGWFLQIERKKRTLFWLTPYKEYFCITFWFGDKAVAVIEKSDVPNQTKERLRNAKKYKIGRSIPIDVRQQKDIQLVEKLLKIKINN